MFSACALLRKGEPCADAVFVKIASCHETRAGLFGSLELIQRLERFPAQFRNLEAFAACDMVRWLCYPAELGYEPTRLQAEARVTSAVEAGDVVHFLWRFTGDKDEEYAGVSGPYPADAGDQPVAGGDTFSNFTAWQSATPEQHLQGVLDTLTRWSIARCTQQASEG